MPKNKLKIKKEKILMSLAFNADRWFDEDSKSWIIYNKQYEICGYGATIEKAKKMFDFCVKDLLYLTVTNSKNNPNAMRNLKPLKK